jgi:hypothetical protein
MVSKGFWYGWVKLKPLVYSLPEQTHQYVILGETI